MKGLKANQALWNMSRLVEGTSWNGDTATLNFPKESPWAFAAIRCIDGEFGLLASDRENCHPMSDEYDLDSDGVLWLREPDYISGTELMLGLFLRTDVGYFTAFVSSGEYGERPYTEEGAAFLKIAEKLLETGRWLFKPEEPNVLIPVQSVETHAADLGLGRCLFVGRFDRLVFRASEHLPHRFTSFHSYMRKPLTNEDSLLGHLRAYLDYIRVLPLK